jgi:hypothetical protein
MHLAAKKSDLAAGVPTYPSMHLAPKKSRSGLPTFPSMCLLRKKLIDYIVFKERKGLHRMAEKVGETKTAHKLQKDPPNTPDS